MSEEIYNQFDTNIKISKVLENSLDRKRESSMTIISTKTQSPLVGKDEAETALDRMKVILYPNLGNFTEYEKAALKYYSNADNFDPEENC